MRLFPLFVAWGVTGLLVRVASVLALASTRRREGGLDPTLGPAEGDAGEWAGSMLARDGHLAVAVIWCERHGPCV